MYSKTHPHGDPIAGWEDAQADVHVSPAAKHYHRVGFEEGRGGSGFASLGNENYRGLRAKTFDSCKGTEPLTPALTQKNALRNV